MNVLAPDRFLAATLYEAILLLLDTFYINGRLVRNENEIATLQPDAIKKVEVITNPGSKYNANVTSVIRITTRKNSEGFALDSKSTFVVNEKGRPSFMQNILAGYHTGKWDFKASCMAHTPNGRTTSTLRRSHIFFRGLMCRITVVALSDCLIYLPFSVGHHDILP